MATIQKKGASYFVIYDYKDINGNRRQKWEKVPDRQTANARKLEIEMQKNDQTFISPNQMLVKEFLEKWSPIHAKANWTYSTYEMYHTLSKNHILPHIGEMRMQDVKPIHIEQLYDILRETRCKGPKSFNKDLSDVPFLSSTTIRHVHNILLAAFAKAVEWQIIQRSPVICDAPVKNKGKTNIWTPEEIAYALDNIDDPRLHLAIHLAFICSMRIGETVALTWDCIDFEKNAVRINKTMQRISSSNVNAIPSQELIFVFPQVFAGKKSVLLLKTPKTETSDRIVFMTKNLKSELLKRQDEVTLQKMLLQEAYNDYGLVLALENGNPIEPKLCEKWFKKWLATTNLPPIVFHDLRRSSSTYKLVLSNGDYKAVQGDTGHASAQILLDVYAKTQDARRKSLAESIQEDFYSKQSIQDASPEDSKRVSVKELQQVLESNPELLANLVNALSAQQNTPCH